MYLSGNVIPVIISRHDYRIVLSPKDFQSFGISAVRHSHLISALFKIAGYFLRRRANRPSESRPLPFIPGYQFRHIQGRDMFPQRQLRIISRYNLTARISHIGTFRTPKPYFSPFRLIFDISPSFQRAVLRQEQFSVFLPVCGNPCLRHAEKPCGFPIEPKHLPVGDIMRYP